MFPIVNLVEIRLVELDYIIWVWAFFQLESNSVLDLDCDWGLVLALFQNLPLFFMMRALPPPTTTLFLLPLLLFPLLVLVPRPRSSSSFLLLVFLSATLSQRVC